MCLGALGAVSDLLFSIPADLRSPDDVITFKGLHAIDRSYSQLYITAFQGSQSLTTLSHGSQSLTTLSHGDNLPTENLLEEDTDERGGRGLKHPISVLSIR